MLKAWWDALWWGPFEPAQRELSKKGLAHVLATIGFTTTYRHDHSHSSRLWHEHFLHVPRLRYGDRQNPASYLPTRKDHLRDQMFATGMSAANIETPLLCFRDA